MKKFLLIVIATVFTIFIAVPVIAISDVVNAVIVDYDIMIDYYNIGNYIENPILSYHDTTYMAIRDIARILNKDVYWDAENQLITMKESNVESSDEQTAIVDNETAKTIGKAIICQFCADEVNDETFYNVSLSEVDCIGIKPIYIISAIFNPDTNNEQSFDDFDAMVEIASDTGEILSVSKKIQGQTVCIFPKK